MNLHDAPALSPDTQAIIRALRETKGDVERQIAVLITEQRKLQADVAALREGFPDGDPDSHRRYHESIIEWRELRNRMVREALIKAAQAGAVGALGWIAYAVWTAFKMEIMK